MKIRLQPYWQSLRESLWFVPSLMGLGSFGLAGGLIEFDAHTAFNGAKQFPLLFGVGAEGSRGMLTAIAGSMLTVAALVFSLTLSAITQVSSQYSPRVLRNFMRDRSNQVVMGYFVSVFAYCLLVLGTIRGTDEQKFVPSTAVLVGLLLALGGVAALIYFIHHIAESLQTSTIVSNISRETIRAIEDLFPWHQDGSQLDDVRIWDELKARPGWRPLLATQAGYIQRIDADGLLHWANEQRMTIRVDQVVGSFVGKNTPLASLLQPAPDSELTQEQALKTLCDYVVIGTHRSIEQDAGFGLQQLVDIALKALSPGINDTTTAIMAVDHLAIIGQELAARPFPSRIRSSEDQLRVVVETTTFEQYIQLAFDLIRINATGNHALYRRLLRTFGHIADAITDTKRKAILRQQADLLLASALKTLETSYEQEQVHSVYIQLSPKWT